MISIWRPLTSLFLAGLIAAGIGACGEAERPLVQIPVANVDDLEPSVRTALTRAQSEFDRIAAAKPTAVELGNAYGELAMTYHAQVLVPQAEAAYANARVLARREQRWPYLLGHLYNDASRLPEAIVAFEVALAIDANDAPTRVSLGEAYLQRGDLDKAEAMYKGLETNDKARAVALTGLGKVALAKRQYGDAVRHLEGALQLAPGAARLRHPLAMAYQGLGDRTKAEETLRRYSADAGEPEVADPLADALGAKVAASRVLLRRGQRFGKAGRFDLAEPAFRAAVEADPTNADAIANLGVSLANLGRLDEAERRLSESLAIDDTNAIAHLSLGVVLDRQGLDHDAVRQYTTALNRDPANIQARVYLADAQMRLGRPEEAVKHYRIALDQSPDSSRTQVSLAFAYIKAGHYNEARKLLEAALQAQPRNAEVINMLARVLATAPAGPVRDGARALELAKALFTSTRNPEVGQTYAMALAETGNFAEAVVLQRETIIVFDRAGSAHKKPFLQRNLALYEQGKPTREAWAKDDPVFRPRSPAAQLAKAVPRP